MSTATAPRGHESRLYHIGVRPGEVAPSILLVGDPHRARRVAENHFESHGGPIAEREFVTYTGSYRGRPMSVTPFSAYSSSGTFTARGNRTICPSGPFA